MLNIKSLAASVAAIVLLLCADAQAALIDFDGTTPGALVTSLEGVTFSSNTGLDIIVSNVFDAASGDSYLGVDDYSRVCVGQLTKLSISGERMVRFLDQLAETRGLPEILVMDNGPEMASKATFFWSQRQQVKLHFIQPGKPTQNAFVESLNARFRDSCLNQQWFRDIHDARSIIDNWRTHYNEERPHSSLGYLPPKTFEQQAA